MTTTNSACCANCVRKLRQVVTAVPVEPLRPLSEPHSFPLSKPLSETLAGESLQHCLQARGETQQPVVLNTGRLGGDPADRNDEEDDNDAARHGLFDSQWSLPHNIQGVPPFIFKLKIRARVFILGGFWTSGYGLAK